ncbi:MAG TPA: hypothetical protein G4O04_09635 [Anaerolineae bacterium]|nr:hypothetical protein [Anaerolineae bacterium]
MHALHKGADDFVSQQGGGVQFFLPQGVSAEERQDGRVVFFIGKESLWQDTGVDDFHRR